MAVTNGGETLQNLSGDPEVTWAVARCRSTAARIACMAVHPAISAAQNACLRCSWAAASASLSGPMRPARGRVLMAALLALDLQCNTWCILLVVSDDMPRVVKAISRSPCLGRPHKCQVPP